MFYKYTFLNGDTCLINISLARQIYYDDCDQSCIYFYFLGEPISDRVKFESKEIALEEFNKIMKMVEVN